MVTYKSVVRDIESFFNSHRMVAQFDNIQTWEFQSDSNNYMAVILIPTTSNVSGNELHLAFSLFFCDLLNSDRSNQVDVYNDTLMVCEDFLAHFSDNPSLEWDIMGDSSIEPFLPEKMDDVLAGWVLSFTAVVPIRKNNCEIPMSE